jgi:hypothetical protein
MSISFNTLGTILAIIVSLGGLLDFCRRLLGCTPVWIDAYPIFHIYGSGRPKGCPIVQRRFTQFI